MTIENTNAPLPSSPRVRDFWTLALPAFIEAYRRAHGPREERPAPAAVVPDVAVEVKQP